MTADQSSTDGHGRRRNVLWLTRSASVENGGESKRVERVSMVLIGDEITLRNHWLIAIC